MKNLQKFFSSIILALTGMSLVFVFQNCGSMEVGSNPLYGSSLGIGCIGVTCDKNINYANFKSTVSGVMIDKPANPAAVNYSVCDNTTCFDLAGFCETGGYPGSVFFYQWLIGGTAPDAEVRTAATCDENGRFHVLVKVPAGKMNWDVSHRLLLYMKVIDDDGTEIRNETGQAEMTYMVSIRI